MVRLEPDFREVHFGTWEGLTREEIQARDPVLYEEWQQGGADFQYPGGDARQEFVTRVRGALDRLQTTPHWAVLAVLHKGVIRVIVEALTGEAPPAEEPELGGTILLSRRPDGSWMRGKTGSDPAGLQDAA